jgi:hypothetical protein
MVALASGDHELSLIVDTLCHFNTVFDKQTWIEESSFMPNEFWTIFRLVWELRLCEFLEVFIRIDIDTVPKLRFALMQIVNRV